MDQTVSNRVLEILRPEQMEIALRAVKNSNVAARQSINNGGCGSSVWNIKPNWRRGATKKSIRPTDWWRALWSDAGTMPSKNSRPLRRNFISLANNKGLELTEEQKTQMLALAEDLPKLWKSPTTSAQDRKRMLRLLLKDITVERRRAEREAVLHVRWQGGAVEDLSVDLPLPAPEKVRYPESMVSRVRTLAKSMTDAQIVATLNQEGVLSAKGKPFTLSMVKWIRGRHEIPAPSLKEPR